MNRPAIKRGFHYNPATNSLGIFVNGIQVADYPETRGRTYYVNNITGSSANDGLSWGSAVDQVSTATTLAEAYRASHAANNQRIRNRIIIQGTENAYASLTALPQHCDVIGLGDDPRGCGQGIARIGPDADGGGALDGVNADACRGSNFYNLQFQAGSAKAAFDCEKIFRCRFENCAFMGNNDSVSPSNLFVAGLSGAAATGGSGVVMKDCHFGGASAGGDAANGIYLAGTHWHNCWVENCFIIGVTGILVKAECVSDWNSVFKSCTITAGWTAQTKSIDDNSATGHIKYVDCRVAIKPTCAATTTGLLQLIGCVVANETAFTAVTNT